MKTQKIIDVLGTDYKNFIKIVTPHIPRDGGKELLFKSVKSADTGGHWFEFGVFKGGTIEFISNTLIELHRVHQIIHGFDSFEGLPEDWEMGRYTKSQTKHKLNKYYPENDYEWLDAVEDKVAKKEVFDLSGQIPEKLLKIKNINIVKGWYDKSLPKFIKENPIHKVNFIHIDSDLYSSAKTILDNLQPYLKGKCVIHFDEFAGYPRAYENEYKAFYEFLTNNRKNIEDVEHIGSSGEAYSFLITFKH